jgi:predicted transcriptional regulator
MAGGKLNNKNKCNRKQGYLASSESNSPTIGSSGYTITPEKQDMDLKSLLMMMMEEFKKEIQENTGKLLEALKEETQKSLKELQEHTTKQVKELNKTTWIYKWK